MLKKAADILRSDAFTPSGAVFPEIDKGHLEKNLKLAEKGHKRGKAGQPASEANAPDHVEMEVISRVEELRRRGLDSFESHRRVYSERLGRATAARMAVEQETQDAISRFEQIVIEYQARMVSPQEQLKEAFAYREQFRKEHRLGTRPARPAIGWGKVIALGLVMVLIESLLNGYLFSQSNPLGLVGGVIAAVLVSAANVSISTSLGMAVKIINSRKIFAKLAGLFVVTLSTGFAVVYNLGVAHFREAVETAPEWRAASERALVTLVEAPAGLETIESWLLLVIGAFISIVAFIKGFASSDLYPGYSQVSQAVHEAREEYIHYLQEAIETLEEQRDETVAGLRETGDEVQRQIDDSVDALFGQSFLISAASTFLEQCDIAVQYLLSVYRDANKAAREDTPPAYFESTYAFQRVELKPVDEERREDAQRAVQEINELISNATQQIYDAYSRAVKAHRNLDELQGTNYARNLPDGSDRSAKPPLKVIEPTLTTGTSAEDMASEYRVT